MKKEQKKLINLIYSNSKYYGKHIIIMGGKVYSTKTGPAASKLLEKLMEKYPDDTPTITYIPKADALIMKLGSVEKMVPVGFLKRDDVPPLLGRYQCLDDFSVLFSSFTTTFSS